MKYYTVKRIFAWVALFGVISCAAYTARGVWFHTSTLFPSSTPTTTFEVTYTSGGYEPDTLEIPIGSRVTFKNMSDKPMRVASDPYPTGTDYPEFQAPKNSEPGGMYTFQFTKTGTFGYHNHEQVSDHGFIHVIDPNNPLPNIDKTKEGQWVVRNKLLALLDPHNPNTIFTVVDTIQADSALSLNCHDIAHDIGHRAYELYGFSEAMTFNNPEHLRHTLVEYICAGGYMHGIVEELALHQPEFATHPDRMCENVPAAERASCYHGVGHAFMFSNNRAIAPSLADCRNTEQLKDTYRCFEGAWMELFWGDARPDAPLGWDLADPLAPCIAAKEDEKPTCLLYSTFGYLRTHVKDYSGAVVMCTTHNLKNSDVEFCLKGLGITMMSKFKGQKLEGSEVYVVGLPDTQKQAFYEGVMGYARLSGVKEDALVAACNRFVRDTPECLAAVSESK